MASCARSSIRINIAEKAIAPQRHIACRQSWRRHADTRVDNNDERVFVAMAAFEDPELLPTIKSLLVSAANPHRLVIGIVWQGTRRCPALEPGALEEISRLWGGATTSQTKVEAASMWPGAELGLGSPKRACGGRLRVLELPSAEARGPCWARYLTELLWEGEEWHAQMDSHMRLCRDWEALCIREVHGLEAAAPTTKPVLTCYGTRYSRGAPPDWAARATVEPPTPPLVLAASHFDEAQTLQIKGSAARACFDAPRRTYLFSANFSFSRGARVAEVAYDPQLQMLFYGEEILFAVSANMCFALSRRPRA